jgi:hypothetical protein
MATFSKIVLSGSTDGENDCRCCYSYGWYNDSYWFGYATTFDEVWLYAVNSDSTDRKLTIEWGDVDSPDDLIEFTVPAESGLYLIAPGLVLQGQRNTACC